LKLEDNVSPQTAKTKQAILVFPFEAHSLIMAALSYRNLESDGYQVAILCYPNTANGSYELWTGTALAKLDNKDYQRIVIIGDRPDSRVEETVEQYIKQWRNQDIELCLLNWHEANWERLYKFMHHGIEAVLGTDWAYFDGQHVSDWHVFWGQIASICTRDPLYNVKINDNSEQAIAQGLLQSIFEIIKQVKTRKINWSEEAETLIQLIMNDERHEFIAQADSFEIEYMQSKVLPEIQKNILVFAKGDESIPPQIYTWFMEKQIEAQGRKFTHSIEFNVPYAIALIHTEDEAELIAVNHWRDETAIPIRLLYPDDIAVAPSGNENSLFIRLPLEQAQAVLQAIVDACNQE
jgi:hypothetical protein